MMTHDNAHGSLLTKNTHQVWEHSLSYPAGEEESIPLFENARAILGARLSYQVETGDWALDGTPLPIAHIVDLANKVQTRRGKKVFLSYPRVATRYDYGLCGMVITQP
jgi:hypothetical protein